jgi:hypothetical protein
MDWASFVDDGGSLGSLAASRILRLALDARETLTVRWDARDQATGSREVRKNDD